LPVDGALPANAGSALVERSLGRIARTLARRHRECELVDEIEAQVSFPLALGDAAEVELAGGPFRHALLLSMLAHDAARTGGDALKAAAGGAFARALAIADTLGLESVAAPLLKGGWRLGAQPAMTLMLQALAAARPRHPLLVEIRLYDEPGAAATMRELARSFGLDAQ
jgi:hypothetical protein